MTAGAGLDLKINKSEVIDMLIEEQKTVIQEAIELEQAKIDKKKTDGWFQDLKTLELDLKKQVLKNECAVFVTQLKTLHKKVNSMLDYTAVGFKKAPKAAFAEYSQLNDYRHQANGDEEKAFRFTWSVPTHIILSNRDFENPYETDNHNNNYHACPLDLVHTNYSDKRPENIFWLRFVIDTKTKEYKAFIKRFTEINDYIEEVKASLKDKRTSLSDLERKTGSIKAKMVRNLLGGSDEGKKLLGQMDDIKANLFSVAQITDAANVQTNGTKKR